MSQPWWGREASPRDRDGAAHTSASHPAPELLAADAESVSRELLGRAPAYAPEWTSRRPDDAGQALVKLFGEQMAPVLSRLDQLPQKFFVSNLAPTGAAEIAGNNSGRTANKGMEGLAITPDGKTLVGIMQTALIQDAADGGDAAKLLRIVTVDIASGKTTHEYGYLLTTGSGVSEIVALNDHEFIVDERDGKGLGDGSKAKVKQFFKIDLNGATDVSSMGGGEAATHVVKKTLFVDFVSVLTAAGFANTDIPAKIEGLAFGDDVKTSSGTVHTLWVANDNDFLQDYSGPNTNPNQFFVVSFTDADLGGSKFVPQQRYGILN